jgi:hypothetical protein
MHAHASDPAPSSTAPSGLRRLALLVALVFGCTTVRHPASSIGEVVTVRDGRAEPQVELWVEHDGPVGPEESAAATAAAKAALEKALEGREAPDPDTLLVVRAQGVARTGAHKRDQRTAMVGIVVGAVVIVTAMVIVIVASKGKSTPRPAMPARAASVPARRAGAGAGALAGAGRGAGAGLRTPAIRPAPAPVVRGGTGTIRPAPTPGTGFARGGARPLPAPRPGPLPRPAPGYPMYPAPYHGYDHGPFFSWGIGFWIDLTPPYYPPPVTDVTPGPWAPPPEPPPAWSQAPDAEDDWVVERPEGAIAGEMPDAAPAPEEVAPPEPAEPDDVAELQLPPPEPLAVDRRGFFDGDLLRLEVWIVDRKTGQPLRKKTVKEGVDPRNAEAVRKALDKVLRPGGWVDV